MTAYIYSDDRRHDPVLRDKVERIHKAQQAKMLEAAIILKKLAAEMRILSGVRDSSSIYDRCYSAVSSAAYSVDKDAAFMQNIGGDTYIGNMAASEMGEYVQTLDMTARFKGTV